MFKFFSDNKRVFIQYRAVILLGLMCLITVDMLQLFIPRIIKWVIDDLTTLNITQEKLLMYAVYIVLAAIFIGIFRFGWRRCLIGMSRKVEEDLRNKLFNHIQFLSASWFEKVKTGDIMAHATNDISHIRMAIGMGMVALTDSVILGSAAIGFMIYINIKLTLFSLIPMPFIVIFTLVLSKKMHLFYKEVQKTFADITEIVRERFAGIRIIKAFNMESEELFYMGKVSESYIDKNMLLVRARGTLFPMMVLFTNISLVIVLYLGGTQTIVTDITPGDFVAFISYLGLLSWPMMAMGWVINLMQRGGASFERINKILEIKPEIIDSVKSIQLEQIKGDIVFKDVCFAYENSNSNIIRNININVNSGNIIGIAGPPGSGKTTLLNLIPRLFDTTKGGILIDGFDIRKAGLESLRANISFMPQEPFIFSGTIRDNINFGARDIGDAAMIKAVKDASLYDFMTSLPQGFETVVGEKGVILSGGQKQRLALARTFLMPAPIMILDDPISQVDVKTSANIINRLKQIAKEGKHTIIIVSHRMSALSFADKIIILEQGRITEQGTHEELIFLNGYYAKTFRSQMIGEELK